MNFFSHSCPRAVGLLPDPQNPLLNAVTALLFRSAEMTPRVWLMTDLSKLCIGVVFTFAALLCDFTGDNYPSWLKPLEKLRELIPVAELHDLVYDLLESLPVFPSPDVAGLCLLPPHGPPSRASDSWLFTAAPCTRLAMVVTLRYNS